MSADSPIWAPDANAERERESRIRLTLLRIMTLWGAMTVSLAFARDAYQFYVIRFLIGAAEAGFLPGVLLYLTYWFPDQMRGRMTSLFVMALPVSGPLRRPPGRMMV